MIEVNMTDPYVASARAFSLRVPPTCISEDNSDDGSFLSAFFIGVQGSDLLNVRMFRASILSSGFAISRRVREVYVRPSVEN